MIVVYTAPNCPPCHLTKRALDRRGLAYEDRDGHAHASRLAEMGMRELPVVVADGVAPWSGFRPDLIEQLGGEHAQ